MKSLRYWEKSGKTRGMCEKKLEPYKELLYIIMENDAVS